VLVKINNKESQRDGRLPMTTYPAGGHPPTSPAPASKEITPELVQKISERVLAMLLSELKIEKERFRPGNMNQAYGKGNRYGG
jgi:hypothetical protein